MTALFDWRRPWPLLAVVGLHVAFFYALQAGLMHRFAATPVVREIVATLIRPEPPKPPPKIELPKPPPKVEPPKRLPEPKPIATPLPPPAPYVAPVITTPSETAITLAPPPSPAPEPAPFEPVAAPVISPPAPPAPVAMATPPPLPVIPPRFDAAYVNNPAPAYPAVAKRMGDEGTVLLRVRVDAQGRADDVQVRTSSGSMRLDDAALTTVREWRFVPARQGYEPVPAWVLVPIVFKLER